MISSFFAIREHNRCTPRMSFTFVAAKMLWNALCISETISYPSHLLQCTPSMPLFLSFPNFVQHLLQFPIRTSFINLHFYQSIQ